jgi:DNA-binding LacI/PurR family transcriptional regulator
VNKTLSLKDVARYAKVSTATVSRVARGQATVDAAIRLRVRKAAEELGIDLEQRRHNKSSIIAFILSNRDVLHSFQARILLGAELFCSAQAQELLFMSFHYSAAIPPDELHLPQILTQRHLVRGVILGGINSPNMLETLRQQDIPFSVLGNNVVGQWNPAEYDCVYSDDVQGSFDLTTQLITDGHSHIYFIGDTDLPWYERCAAGYRKGMQQAGLQPCFSEIHSEGRELGYLAMRSILSRHEPATAIFAGSDPIARGVYDAVRQAGLSIPDDLCVSGFNDTEASLLFPQLTSVREFPEELGRHLAEFVIKRLKSPGRQPEHITIPTRAIIRESTRWASRSKPDGVCSQVLAPSKSLTSGCL